MRTSCLLGLDVGGTSIKCIAMTPQGQTLAVVRSSSGGVHIPYGVIAEKLLGNVLRVLAATVSRVKTSYPLVEFLGISVSAMGCAAVILDRGGRQLFLPVCESKTVSSISADPYFTTGYHSGYPNFRFNLFHAGEFAETTLQNAACILSVCDYITYSLSGETSGVYNSASSLSLIDLQKRTWCPGAILPLAMPERALPNLMDSGVMLGCLLPEIAQRVGLPSITPVVSGGQDYLCAGLAAGGDADANIVNVIGTFDVYSIAQNRYKPSALDSLQCANFWDCHILPGSYSHTYETVGAFWTELMRKRLIRCGLLDEKPLSWRQLLESLEDYIMAPVETKTILCPPMAADAASVEQFQRALVDRLRSDSSIIECRDALAGIIAGLNLNALYVLSAALSSADTDKPIVAFGGGTRNAFWMANKADVLGRAIYLPNVQEASATGAALLAGVGVGIYRSLEEEASVFEKTAFRIYEPDPQRHKQWVSIYHERLEARKK